MQIHSLVRTVGRLSRAIAPVILLCALPIRAQQQPPASSDTVAAAPVQEQISLKSNPGSELAAPVPSQIVVKNDRLFYVMANYTTVENHDQFAPLSAKTKFLLSTKTMSDRVTVSFIAMISLIGQARNTDRARDFKGTKG